MSICNATADKLQRNVCQYFSEIISSHSEDEEYDDIRNAHDLIKTLVLRRGEDDFLFVLVPGDREFSWPKLRALLGVSRLSMPDAATAREVTGYEAGTITPFGSTTAWPVIADRTVAGRRISMGGGAHGVGLTVDADAALEALGARLADISD